MTDVHRHISGQVTPDNAPGAGTASGKTKLNWLAASGLSAAIFLFSFGFMADRVRSGTDPVLGKPEPVAVPVQKEIHRIIVVKRVIVDQPKVAVASASSGNGTAPAASTYTAPAASAPVYTAPASAPAPRAVTRGS